jgi:hypothetical protein
MSDETKGKYDTPIKKADTGYRELDNIRKESFGNMEKKEKPKK